jgi:hypothetical protein
MDKKLPDTLDAGALEAAYAAASESLGSDEFGAAVWGAFQNALRAYLSSVGERDDRPDLVPVQSHAIATPAALPPPSGEAKELVERLREPWTQAQSRRVAVELEAASLISSQAAQIASLEAALNDAAGELDEAADKFWVIHCNHPGARCGRGQAEDKAFLATMHDRMAAAVRRARSASSAETQETGREPVLDEFRRKPAGRQRRAG